VIAFIGNTLPGLRTPCSFYRKQHKYKGFFKIKVQKITGIAKALQYGKIKVI